MAIDLLRETKLQRDTTAMLQYSQFVRNISILSTHPLLLRLYISSDDTRKCVTVFVTATDIFY